MARIPVRLMKADQRARVMSIIKRMRAKRTKTMYHGSFEVKNINLNRIKPDEVIKRPLNDKIVRNAFHVGTLRAAKFRVKEVNILNEPSSLFRVKVKTNKLASRLGDPTRTSDTLANLPSHQKTVKSAGFQGILYRNKVEDVGSKSAVIWDEGAIKSITRINTRRNKPSILKKKKFKKKADDIINKFLKGEK